MSLISSVINSQLDLVKLVSFDNKSENPLIKTRNWYVQYIDLYLCQSEYIILY